jgi:hypothetical protein
LIISTNIYNIKREREGGDPNDLIHRSSIQRYKQGRTLPGGLADQKQKKEEKINCGTALSHYRSEERRKKQSLTAANV